MSENLQNHNEEAVDAGRSLLHCAAKNNDVKKIKRLLAQGADVNSRDKKNQTPLHLANGDAVQILLENGADVNAQDTLKRTPLHCLLLNTSASVEVVELFLKFDADVNMRDNYGCTPLSDSVFAGHRVEVVKALIRRSTENIDSTRRQLHNTLLHLACGNKNIELVKFLVKSGASTEATNTAGCTPLIISLMDRTPDEKLICFLFKYSDINDLVSAENNILTAVRHSRHELARKLVLQHLAKFQALNLPIHQCYLDIILNERQFNDYFEACLDELMLAKNTKLENCWVTLFNLLVDGKKKLKKYARNRDLIQSFNEIDLKKFPIYGSLIQKNVSKAIKTSELFDRSIIKSSNCLPAFNPTHLVIENVLDCLTFNDYILFLSASAEFDILEDFSKCIIKG